ncbi:sensor histidine kinase [Nonomuraea sp. SBT364]|uniref:sensor histidine kinase n=1 Tax=Nonomuraea sp. SBT364 TaxID=1580530 RepID=UPI00066CA116|nr:histidine kinase [Nonomuraea sp. SBT364]
MVTRKHEHGRPRGARAALSRLTRLGDVPVVVMLAWAGWLAVPWSLNGLAQARAAAAAAAGPPPPPPYHDVRPSTPLHARHDAPPEDVPRDVRPGAFLQDVPQEPGPAADALRTARLRAELAGEVHDAAGHGLAAIAMQAGVALVSLDDDPGQARRSLEAIRETSTRALSELRAALDRLDGGGPTGARTDDQAGPTDHETLTDLTGLTGLTGLIAGVRAAGLPVDVEPARPDVPAHLRGAVYGVVRESLTNVLRHAGPTRAVVRVAADPCAFVLEVADRGVGWTGAAEGRGVAGMRARVTGAGGRLTAGPREGGGFRVVASFPRNRPCPGEPDRPHAGEPDRPHAGEPDRAPSSGPGRA